MSVSNSGIPKVKKCAEFYLHEKPLQLPDSSGKDKRCTKISTAQNNRSKNIHTISPFLTLVHFQRGNIKSIYLNKRFISGQIADISWYSCSNLSVDMSRICMHSSRLKIVWVKIYGSPNWPGQIDVTCEYAKYLFHPASKYIKTAFPRCGKVRVRLFGMTDHYKLVSKKDISPLQSNLGKRVSDGLLKKTNAFFAALNEVSELCSTHPRLPKAWWNEKCLFKSIWEIMHPPYNFREAFKARLHKAKDENVVWVPVGENYFPAQILPSTFAAEFYENVYRDTCKRTDLLPVVCFGTGKVSLVSEESVISFEAGLVREYHKLQSDDLFKISLVEAWKFLEVPTNPPQGMMSGSVWWSTPTIEATSQGMSRGFGIPGLCYLGAFKYITKCVWERNSKKRLKSVKTDLNGTSKCSCNENQRYCSDSTCLNFAMNIFCSSKNCSVKNACKNQPFEKRTQLNLVPCFSADNRGWGLRTTTPIARGGFVIEYVGELIDCIEYSNRLKLERAKGLKDLYAARVSARLYIDARRKGNMGRFINSSCAPNCELQLWDDEIQPRMGVFAKREISAGEEITLNYPLNSLQQVNCECGSHNCVSIDDGIRKRLQNIIGYRVNCQWDKTVIIGIAGQYNQRIKLIKVDLENGDCDYASVEQFSREDGSTKYNVLAGHLY